MFPLVEVNEVLPSLQIQIPKAVLLGAIPMTMHNEAGYDEQEEKGLKRSKMESYKPLSRSTEWTVDQIFV